jgi:tetratricopeptide (TPR) repeat protein
MTNCRGPCCFPGSFKTIVFLVDGIVPNGRHYRNLETALSREIARLSYEHGFDSTPIPSLTAAQLSLLELRRILPPFTTCWLLLKSVMSTRTVSIQLLRLSSAALLLSAGAVFAQSGACSAVSPHPATPAEVAYQQAKYENAEGLYQQALVQKPNDPELNLALVHTLLHENRISDASTRATKAVAEDPHSADALTAVAEVQLRQGQPWLASQTLDSAAAADPCFARVHLIRSRIFRIDSMYASERAELQAAYQIDPSDPDIHRAWIHTVNPAHDVQRIKDSLATETNLDPDIREKALASANSMMSLLSENSQTCQGAPITAAITLPLSPSYENAKQVNGYKLGVEFPSSKAKLIVDTAASGLYISRALADANGFQRKEGAPANTVQADTVHIGPLEFRNCMVGVNDEPFAAGVEGYIGTDVFAPYLVTLNLPEAKLQLEPLPLPPGEQKNAIPGNRYFGPEVESFSPVFHKNQFLLVPVMLNKKDRRLFVLDTGIRLSTMTSEVAHAISNTRLNFTNSVQTVSGSTLHIYRDSFDLQFANLSLDNQGHILEFDPSAVDQSAGMEVAGMLGFDILHSLVMHIDYRDGLVRFDSPGSGPAQMTNASNGAAPTPSSNDANNAACNQYANQDKDHPIDSTIQGGIVGWLDSGHLKPGQSINVKVLQDWIAPNCALTSGALLYGHVLAATSSKKPGGSELALVFDHGDCIGHPKQELSLRIIGVAGGDTAFKGVHNAMPTEVSGGAKAISDTAGSMGLAPDVNLNAGVAPKTVRPGLVAGIPHLKLLPEGGPQCSAMLTSEEHSVHIGIGTEFILTMESLP